MYRDLQCYDYSELGHRPWTMESETWRKAFLTLENDMSHLVVSGLVIEKKMELPSLEDL